MVEAGLEDKMMCPARLAVQLMLSQARSVEGMLARESKRMVPRHAVMEMELSQSSKAKGKGKGRGREKGAR